MDEATSQARWSMVGVSLAGTLGRWGEAGTDGRSIQVIVRQHCLAASFLLVRSTIINQVFSLLYNNNE